MTEPGDEKNASNPTEPLGTGANPTKPTRAAAARRSRRTALGPAAVWRFGTAARHSRPAALWRFRPADLAVSAPARPALRSTRPATRPAGQPGQYGQPGQPYGQQQYYGTPQGYYYPEQKSRLVGGLLGILLGGLGVHRFYLGHIGIGVLQIVVTFLTFGVGAVWGFIEGIMILVGAEPFKRDARGVPLKE